MIYTPVLKRRGRGRRQSLPFYRDRPVRHSSRGKAGASPCQTALSKKLKSIQPARYTATVAGVSNDEVRATDGWRAKPGSRRYYGMTESDQYVLGYRHAEQKRLQLQAQQLAHESNWLF